MNQSTAWLHTLDPIALHLPFWPHGIHWYGLMYLLAFGAFWWLGRMRLRAGRLPVSDQAFGDLAFYGMFGVVLGGRFGYVLFYAFGDLLSDPLLLFRIKDGGMSFHGGLLGVIAAVLFWSWKQRLHAFDTLDFVAPLVPLGLGFGRLGNFIGGELWGRSTGGQGGVIFHESLPAPWYHMSPDQLDAAWRSGALDEFARYPSQLYQAGLEGLAMFVLLWWFSRRPRGRYAVSGLFALLYGAFRILVEFVREPDAHIGYLAWGWLTMGQVLSLPLVVLGIALLLMSRRAPVLALAAGDPVPAAAPAKKGAKP